MELEVKINASAKEVFDELLLSIQEDIKNSTGKKVASEKIVQDYSYNKKLKNYVGNDVSVNVNIDKLVYPSEYATTITNPKGKSRVGYSLCDCDDGVKITYKEETIYDSIFQRLNHTIMSLLYTRSSKKKMIRNFNFLEKQIEDKRVK